MEDQAEKGEPRTVAVSGSHGLLGSALVEALGHEGHPLKRIVRRAGRGEDEVGWRPDSGEVEADKLDDVEAVIHLAGEPVAGRWTEAKKRAIRRSRVEGTHQLASALAGMSHPPGVLISASAIGYYGDRGDEWLDETAPPGEGFLAEVCVEWEQAAEPARRKGLRVVHPRISPILTPTGGVLRLMLPPFKAGVGGPVGSGRQWVSWITRGDMVRVIRHALGDEQMQGPVNGSTPHPVTNAELARTLAQVLHRPSKMRVPPWAARLAVGELADQGMLASTRCRPRRLEEADFSWHHPDLVQALSDLLGG